MSFSRHVLKAEEYKGSSYRNELSLRQYHERINRLSEVLTVFGGVIFSMPRTILLAQAYMHRYHGQP